MKIAVTAASGQLGRAVVARLKQTHSPGDIVAVVRTPEKAADLGVTVRQASYGDREAFKAAFEDVETALLISGNDHPEKRIDQHRGVIAGAEAAGVRRLVYTSVQGPETGGGFANVVGSNRRTEADLKASSLEWIIGRNGIYIEPDLEYIEGYRQAGAIRNCAGEGRCAYTTRSELANAYAVLLTTNRHAGQTFNLSGEPITQAALAGFMNKAFGADLTYEHVDFEIFKADRMRDIGDFYGEIVAGIYRAISEGAFDNQSEYEVATGRPHVSWTSFFGQLAQ